MNKFLVVLSALFLLAPAASRAADKREKPAPRYGINHDFVWTDDKEIPGLIKSLKKANVQAVRIPMRWTMVEPERGMWDFSKMDRVVRQLKDADVEVLPILMSVPAWASGITPEQQVGFWDCYPPKSNADWAEFCRRCAYRYKKEIRYWEIWNEENGVDFYKPTPNAKEYVELLKIAHSTIKKIDPSAQIVMGGLQMNGIIANPWSDVKTENYLQDVYDAGGKPYFDAVNIHPYVYSTKEEGTNYLVGLVHDTVKVMQKNGDAKKPLWITEVNAADSTTITPEAQAEFMEESFRELWQIAELKSVYWFTLRDYKKSITGGETGMGMMTNDNKPKPSY